MPRNRVLKNKAPIPNVHISEKNHLSVGNIADEIISGNNKRKRPQKSVPLTDNQPCGNAGYRCGKRTEDTIDNSNEEDIAVWESNAIHEKELAIVEFVGTDRCNGEELGFAEFNTQGSPKPKKVVHFNGDGQPVGEGSISFVSYLGSMSRKHCPISYEHWKDVPDQIKKMIWKLVTEEYIVSGSYEKQILQRINKHWREFKSKLRSKHYDRYETDEERKINCPRGVGHGDWEIFVDNQSTPNAQARRGKGKSAREALKTPHTYGRRGAARTIKTAKGGVSQSHQQRSATPEVSDTSLALGPEHARSENLGSSKQKKMVHFNQDGQPIGEGSVSFTSNLGLLTRKHCPISYEQWRDVPDQIKEMMWKLVTDRYTVTETFKEQILKRVGKHWREFKCQLRSKHYDRFYTDEERKRNCPRGVRQKDWDIFVHNQSTPNAQARRRRAKSAREGLKTPHTSGRRGAARTAEDLRKRDRSSAIVSRTGFHVGTHSVKDGSCPKRAQHIVEQREATVVKYPSSSCQGPTSVKDEPFS